MVRRASTWYASPVPRVLPRQELKAAAAAVEYAQTVRSAHRRRSDPTSIQRLSDVDEGLRRIKRAMRPIRSMIGAFPYGPPGPEAEKNRQILRDVSSELQSERRKLWKMRPREEEA